MRLFNIFFLTMLVALPAIAQAPGGQKPPVSVIVSTVERKSFFDEVEALGTLKANESVDVTSTVTERVTDVFFEDNQSDKKGDVLLKMDSAEEFAELAEQKSFLAEAQRQVNRLSPLVRQGAASASTLDERKREVLGAKARIDAIQSRIDQRIIKAPYDGVLGLRNISIGALVQPGVMITTIDDIGIMKLDFSIPEIFVSTLKSDAVVCATTDAYPDEVFTGRISSIDSRIDPVTRSVVVRALIDNTDGVLRPGLLMHVVLEKNARHALVIPEEALMTSGPNNFVFVVKMADGQATTERRSVLLGARAFGDVEILDGLEEQEQIITHGILRVRPGAPVQIQAEEQDNKSLTEMLQPKTETGQEHTE